MGGVLRIYYPAGLTPKDSGCRNDLIGGSKLPNDGFLCVLNTADRSLIISGFPGFSIVAPATSSDVKILFRMLNPTALGSPGTWQMEQVLQLLLFSLFWPVV